MPEVYTGNGDTCFETGRDLLVARLDELETDMAGYEPAIDNVYDRHNVANLRLNAVTVGLAAPNGSVAAYSRPLTQGTMGWTLVYSIRVHTAYSGGIKDDQKSARLLNSIVNKLLAKRSLSLTDRYVITEVNDIKNAVEFEESASIGGEVMVTIDHFTTYTQES
jgi:3-phenylpropionate/cinnamic acid dioxygenase small subunit